MPHYKQNQKNYTEKEMRQESVKLTHRFRFNEVRKNYNVGALLT